MHAFWSKRWHQLFRQTFMVVGGYPGKRIAGDVGMVFGVFIASGLYHECGMYAMGRGFDHTVIVFFALQGPLLILERLWRHFTGRRVRGWMGRFWVYFILFIVAQPMGMYVVCFTDDTHFELAHFLVDTWHRRGLGGGMVIPPVISPVRWILVPVIQRIILQTI
jgi:hypothetical protein